ncbi:hypothetical protein CEXT_292021 [Caerostris extrusa]|uniref:Uncharacterized protein n=1 Tax=Caerostris extrusa TaxID=172846 RepID=A0AAV4TPB5_CAEEX|nr:hypothetical protein CEXT_292021 [Caerostris extrusa]
MASSRFECRDNAELAEGVGKLFIFHASLLTAHVIFIVARICISHGMQKISFGLGSRSLVYGNSSGKDGCF